MFTTVRDNLRRFAPERLQARGLVDAMRSGESPEPWRLRAEVEGKSVDYRFFFVCGFGKSGTNWVNNLLNLHPAVRCDGELYLSSFGTALEQFTGPEHQIGHTEPHKSVATQGVYDLVRRLMLLNLREKPGATVLGDRSPRPIASVLPGAPTLWLVRDGRDVVVSYTYHYLRLKPEFNIRHWSASTREFFTPFAERFHASPPESCFETARDLLAQKRWVGFVSSQWAKRVTMDLDAQASYPDPLLELRYEALHADTAGELARMLAFLGLDASDAGPIGEEGRTQAGFAEENPTDFFRKGAVGDWRNYDTPAFREAFDEKAGDAAARAGYGEWTSAA
ncbi:MAG: sulfotransferase domain-containing protein [Planctomycetota bacterium]